MVLFHQFLLNKNKTYFPFNICLIKDKLLIWLYALQFPSYGTGCNAALEDCKLFNNILKDVVEMPGKIN
jgi:hypothetical protein